MVARQLKYRAVIVFGFLNLTLFSSLAKADTSDGFVVWRKTPATSALLFNSQENDISLFGEESSRGTKGTPQDQEPSLNRGSASTFGSTRLEQNSIKDLGRGFALLKPSNQLSALTLRQEQSEPEITEPLFGDFCAKFIFENPDYGCEPNFTYKAFISPDDPKYGEMWGLNGVYGIDAPNAWDITTGSSDVVVAVVDTGVDYSHPDLAQNMWVNPFEIAGNSVDDDGNGYIDDIHGVNTITDSGDPRDDNGHGTHVSGTIAAVSNNSFGVSGIGWRTKVMGLKFLSASGSGNLSDAIAAINYMVEMKQRGVNIRVSNHSWGGSDYSAALETAIRQATEAGILFAVAAGNESNDNDAAPSYPASYTFNELLSVAAIDIDGQLAQFSNYGFTSVHIAAPGVDILSTTPDGGFSLYSGTSMATPHVSGVAALIAASEPNLRPAQLASRIMESGIPISGLEGKVYSGRLLNANRALRNIISLLPDYSSGEPCTYAFSEVGSGTMPPFNFKVPDSKPLIVDDELGFKRIKLDFEVPFFERNYSRIFLSPNGVIYFDRPPSDMDFINKAVAPERSIAVLHSDLFYPEERMGVFVEKFDDRVQILWFGRHYSNPRSGWVKAWAVLNASGEVYTHYQFSDSETQNVAQQNSTVGVRKVTPPSATTFSYNKPKLPNFTTLNVASACLVIAPLVYQFDLTGTIKNKVNSKSAVLGGQLHLNITTNRAGIVPVFFWIGDKNRCSNKVNATVGESLSSRLVGRLPAKRSFPSGVSRLISQARGTSRSISLVTLDSRGRTRKIPDKRHKLRSSILNSTCSRLIGSFKP